MVFPHGEESAKTFHNGHVFLTDFFSMFSTEFRVFSTECLHDRYEGRWRKLDPIAVLRDVDWCGVFENLQPASTIGDNVGDVLPGNFLPGME